MKKRFKLVDLSEEHNGSVSGELEVNAAGAKLKEKKSDA